MTTLKALDALTPEQAMRAYLQAFVDGDMSALNALFADHVVAGLPGVLLYNATKFAATSFRCLPSWHLLGLT